LPGSQSSFTVITEYRYFRLKICVTNCTNGYYQLPHSVFVKLIYYTLTCSWARRVRFVHSSAA
jgi:hypothetical protein